jgi:hypothetical protein
LSSNFYFFSRFKRILPFFALGIRSFDTRNNVRYIDPTVVPSLGSNGGPGSLIYHAAGLGVLLDPEKGEQRFFKGHTDDIMALAVFVPPHDGKHEKASI